MNELYLENLLDVFTQPIPAIVCLNVYKLKCLFVHFLYIQLNTVYTMAISSIEHMLSISCKMKCKKFMMPEGEYSIKKNVRYQKAAFLIVVKFPLSCVDWILL